jgi:small subunit ribosomal protein S9
MADDEKTPDATDETAEGQDSQPAGPVADEDSSSSQAADEESSSTPPTADAIPSDTDAPSAGDSVGGPTPEEALATGGGGGSPAEAGPAAEEAESEKKKDVIPGADLEPIAVESEGRELSAEERARLEAEEEEKAKREAALVGADEPEDEAASRAPAQMESGARYLATGKRKRSIARVTLVPGDGKFEVNKRPLEEFFPRPLHQTMARQPLSISGYEGNVDVRVRVHGGGISGQAGAVRHGVARALTEIDAELRGDLKRRGFLTRDARVKERRKAGLKKARKRPQFSKR